MKILVGFEESQTITIELRKLGHIAYSCDIKTCSGGHPEWHYQCDIYKLLSLKYKWDMFIFHPECTKVCVSGNGTYAKGKPKYNERIYDANWIEKLWFNCIKICDKVCFENPVGVLTTMTNLPKPQYIQPYQFGHMETKKTALFLHGLPKLKETNNVKYEMDKLPIKEKHKIWYASPGKNRSELRSKTFLGIAKAMATQWTQSDITEPKLF